MKKLLSGIGRAFFPFRNPKRMLGWDQLTESFNHSVRNPTKEVWGRKNKRLKPAETFEQVAIRLNMSEAALATRKQSLFRTTLLFLTLSVILLIYAINLLFIGLFLGTFIAGVLTFIALALAFREHFWYTQIKHRHLGINFKEWLNYATGSGGIKR